MSDTKRFDRKTELSQQSPLLLCRAEQGGYKEVPHLVTGDKAAIALGATCFRPRVRNRAGDTGWFGTGSKRFVVKDVLLIEGAVFHIGEVVRGGFHIDKAHGLKLMIDPNSPARR